MITDLILVEHSLTSECHKSYNRLCMYLVLLILFSSPAGRGHTVRAVSESFHMSKDAGFKVVAHMMPDLPNVGLERDIEQFIVSSLFHIF